MHRTLGRALAAVLLLAPLAQAAELSPVEQRIVQAVKANAAADLDLLERSVRINSGTQNVAGVRAVGELFRKEFDQLGFATRWIAMPPEMGRAGHLVAEHSGTRGKRLLLLGHMDTVFEPGSPAPLWQRDGKLIRGQGVADMKGGDVIVVAALRALRQAGVLDDTRIAVMFTGDEEEAGHPKSISRADMVALAKRSDAALGFEGMIADAQGRASATVGRRATATFDLEVRGRQGHSQGVFGSAGYGAIYEAARILDGFRQQVVEPGLTFNPGMILGGTEVQFDPELAQGKAAGKTNVIANSATVSGDLRYLDYAQRDRAHAAMRAIVAHSLPGASAQIRFADSYPPMAVTPGNLALLDAYSQASDAAGLGPIVALPATARGAGDIQFVAPYVDSLDGLGARGDGAHSPDEQLDPASLQHNAIRAALLIYRLTR